MCGRESGVPEDADGVIKLQLMGKWISALDYSVEQGSHCKKSDKPLWGISALNKRNVANQHNKRHDFAFTLKQ